MEATNLTSNSDTGLLAKAMDWTTNMLNDLELGTTMSVAEVRVHDKALLIECIKQYIDRYGGVEFSSDYAAFRKIPRWSELITETR